jgi:hypothetical protein
MKQKISLLLLLALIILSSSCKKDSEDKRTVALEYRIEPDLKMVYQVTYTDASGMEVKTPNAEGDFPGGSKKLNVRPPFTAKLLTDVDNYSPYVKFFTLTILVDGEVKAVKEFPIGALLEGVGTVEYKIE